MLRLLFSPVNGKGWAVVPGLPAKVWTPLPKGAGSEVGADCERFGFLRAKAVPRSRGPGRAGPGAGWGRRARGHGRVGRGPGFGGSAAGASSEPHRAGDRAAGRPQQAPRRRQTPRTHRSAVLLQRHQFAPDVDRLEVVEVLLLLRAGRSPQEQPRRCHRRRHHGLFRRWRRREGKDGAGGSSAGGGRRRLWRRSARKAGRAAFSFPPQEVDARLWTSVSPSVLRQRTPAPDPRARVSGFCPLRPEFVSVRLPLVPGNSDLSGTGKQKSESSASH